jgi:hypothetical protein
LSSWHLTIDRCVSLNLGLTTVSSGVIYFIFLWPNRENTLLQEQLVAPGSRETTKPQKSQQRDTRYFTTRKLPITRASMPELKNVQMASVGVHTIASPRKLNDVFNSTGTPVRLPNSSIRCQ